MRRDELVVDGVGLQVVFDISRHSLSMTCIFGVSPNVLR